MSWPSIICGNLWFTNEAGGVLIVKGPDEPIGGIDEDDDKSCWFA